MTVAVSNDWYSAIGNNRLFGVPILVILAAVACLVMRYLLSQTKFGQHTYAMGASQVAARRAGINIRVLTIKVYLLSAIMGGSRARSALGASRRARRKRVNRYCSIPSRRSSSAAPACLAALETSPAPSRAPRYRRYSIRSRFHRRAAVLAVHCGRCRHHRLRARRADAAPLSRSAPS